MKTAGELLASKRLEKALSLEDVAKKLKVQPKYLAAIEQNAYNELPGATATKGFLRNYARILYLNPETILAMFRRDYTADATGQIIPRGMLAPLSHAPRLISANFIFSVIAISSFLGFLGFQLFEWLRLPKLHLLQPENGEIYVSKVTIKGTTDKDAVISINNQKVIVNDSGQFSLDLIFSEGTHSIVVQATNRAGKVRLLERTFQVAK